MNRSRTLVTVLAVLCASLISSTVHALANRVFVSARSGNDANSCDNILTPCQTFAGSVLQVNPGGEVIVLDSGGYGPVTITKALTIEAPPGVLAFIHPASGNAITVSAGISDTVVLRGLTLNGGLEDGIIVTAVGSLYVESCVISGFGTSGLFNGIDFAGTGKLFVKDTIVRNCTGDGVSYFATSIASLDHCRFEGNGVVGFRVLKGRGTVRDSVSSGNGYGFATQLGVGAPEINVENCLVAGNSATGVGAFGAGAGGPVTTVSNSVITDNGTGIEGTGGSTLFTRGNNTITGNTIDVGIGTTLVSGH